MHRPTELSSSRCHIKAYSVKQEICEKVYIYIYIKTPWPESVRELYRQSDRRLSAKLAPTFVDRGCHVVSVKDSYCRILGFLDRSSYFFFQVAPQLYSWGWFDPVPDPLLLRESGSSGNLTRISGSEARNYDTRPQRWSTFFYITYINSIRTSQETQYISVQQPGTLTTRQQRPSTFFYITNINSVRSSQETQYISAL
jgi:hypothetical protein